MVRIVEAILRAQDAVPSVSTLIKNYYGIIDVYLSLPCVIGHNGIKQVMQLNLNQEKQAGIVKSATLPSVTWQILN